MKNKIAFFFLAVVGVCVLIALGFLIGATWGANYAEDFIAFGTRGYEATGLIGEVIGLIAGVLLAIFSYRKLFGRKNTL